MLVPYDAVDRAEAAERQRIVGLIDFAAESMPGKFSWLAVAELKGWIRDGLTAVQLREQRREDMR